MLGVRTAKFAGQNRSAHPIEGGSANDYDYAFGDCVNNYDLDGRLSTKGWFGRYEKCMSAYKGLMNFYSAISIDVHGAANALSQFMIPPTRDPKDLGENK